jgi:hypothetical protein
MKNVKTMLKIFMDDKQLSAWLKELLRSRDPEFCPVEKACLHAAEGMGGLETLLDLRHRQLVSDLRFAIWQGFKLNLENFRSPLGAAALKLDYSQLLQEHIMFSLPSHSVVQKELDLLTGAMTAEQREAMEPVEAYFAYLETVGLKVAHYLGFRMGDVLYPMVEPGYVADPAATQRCRWDLEQYIGFTLE